MKPNTAEKVEAAQRKQKAQHNAKAKVRVVRVGDLVYVRCLLLVCQLEEVDVVT